MHDYELRVIDAWKYDDVWVWNDSFRVRDVSILEGSEEAAPTICRSFERASTTACRLKFKSPNPSVDKMCTTSGVFPVRSRNAVRREVSESSSLESSETLFQSPVSRIVNPSFSEPNSAAALRAPIRRNRHRKKIPLLIFRSFFVRTLWQSPSGSPLPDSRYPRPPSTRFRTRFRDPRLSE